MRAKVTMLLGVVTILLIAFSISTGSAQTPKRPITPASQPPSSTPAAVYAGEIRAFAGPIPPKGWLVCDGREFNEIDYPELYNAIGDLWGSSAPGKFKIPDLRGLFLRGWNDIRGDRYSDPDAAGRELSAGAPVDPARRGNQVGSLQSDQFLFHHHDLVLTARWGDRFADTIGWGADNGQHPAGNILKPTGDSGGSETRPRNAYVLFCVFSGKM